MTDLFGSITLKYTTALTRAGTLSRVITSWGGTSMVTVLKSILTILSTSGIRINRPGPLALPWTLPRRKITPRSYSLTTLIALNNTEATSMATTTRAMNANPMRSCSSPVATNHKDSTTSGEAPDTREGGRFRTSLSRFSPARRVPLEKPPRPNVAVNVVYVGDGHFTNPNNVARGVDGSPVAHGYADVGDVSAAVLAPEEQVSRLGGTVDRRTVAHLPTR